MFSRVGNGGKFLSRHQNVGVEPAYSLANDEETSQPAIWNQPFAQSPSFRPLDHLDQESHLQEAPISFGPPLAHPRPSPVAVPNVLTLARFERPQITPPERDLAETFQFAPNKAKLPVNPLGNNFHSSKESPTSKSRFFFAQEGDEEDYSGSSKGGAARAVVDITVQRSSLSDEIAEDVRQHSPNQNMNVSGSRVSPSRVRSVEKASGKETNQSDPPSTYSGDKDRNDSTQNVMTVQDEAPSLHVTNTPQLSSQKQVETRDSKPNERDLTGTSPKSLPQPHGNYQPSSWLKPQDQKAGSNKIDPVSLVGQSRSTSIEGKDLSESMDEHFVRSEPLPTRLVELPQNKLQNERHELEKHNPASLHGEDSIVSGCAAQLFRGRYAYQESVATTPLSGRTTHEKHVPVANRLSIHSSPTSTRYSRGGRGPHQKSPWDRFRDKNFPQRPMRSQKSAQETRVDVLKAHTKSNISKKRVDEIQNFANNELKRSQVAYASGWNDMFVRQKEYEKKLKQALEESYDRIGDLEDALLKMQNEKSAKIKELEEFSGHNHQKNRELKDKLHYFKEEAKTLSAKLKDHREALARAKEEISEQVSRKVEEIDSLKAIVTEERNNHLQAVRQSSEAQQLLEERLNDLDNVNSQAQKQVAEHVENITALQEQLKDRQHEVSQKSKIIEDLTQQLDDTKDLNEKTLRTLAQQNDTILSTIHGQQKELAQSRKVADEQRENLAGFASKLDEISGRIQDPREVIEKLRESQEDAMSNIMTELKKIMVEREENANDQRATFASIESIRETCNEVCERLSNDKKVEDLRNALESKARDMEIMERSKESLNQQLKQATEQWSANAADKKAQQQRIESLHTELKEVQEAAKRAESLRQENFELQDALQTHKDELRASQEMFKEARTGLEAERQNLIETYQLNQKEQEDKVAGAVRQQTQRMQEVEQNLRKRLEAAEQTSARLDHELGEARWKIQSLTLAGGPLRKDLENFDQAVRSKVDEIKKTMESAESTREELQAKLETWTTDRRQLLEITTTLRQLQQEQADAAEVKNVLQGLGATGSSEQSLPATKNHDALPSPFRLLGEGPVPVEDLTNRRVVLQSPMLLSDDETAPPTIEEERKTRRVIQPQKSSIKPQKSSTVAWTGFNKIQKTSKQIASLPGSRSKVYTHSSFNRPVSGGMGQETSSIPSGSPKRTLMSENEQQPKRQRPSIHVYPIASTSTNFTLTYPDTKYGPSHEGTPGLPSEVLGPTSLIPPRLARIGERGGPLRRRSTSLKRYGSRKEKSETQNMITSMVDKPISHSQAQPTAERPGGLNPQIASNPGQSRGAWNSETDSANPKDISTLGGNLLASPSEPSKPSG